MADNKWWMPDEYKELSSINDPEKRKKYARQRLSTLFSFKDQFINLFLKDDTLTLGSFIKRYLKMAWLGNVKLNFLALSAIFVSKILYFIGINIPALEYPIVAISLPIGIWYYVSLWRCAFNIKGKRWVGWTFRSIQIIGTVAFIVGGGIQARIYFYTLPVVQCSSFSSDPRMSIKACTNLLEKLKQTAAEDFIADPPYVSLWLHLANLHAGVDDQQEFVRSSVSYINDKWPSPIIELYTGKATVADVFAKAKTAASSERNGGTSRPVCEANFYIGEWYLLMNMKEEAQQTLQVAKSICNPKQVEWVNIQRDLKTLGVE